MHDVAEGTTLFVDLNCVCPHSEDSALTSSPAYAAIVGDITPNDGISKEQKRKLESDAIVEIQKMLGTGSAAGDHQPHAASSPATQQNARAYVMGSLSFTRAAGEGTF